MGKELLKQEIRVNDFPVSGRLKTSEGVIEIKREGNVEEYHYLLKLETETGLIYKDRLVVSIPEVLPEVKLDEDSIELRETPELEESGFVENGTAFIN